MNVVMNIFNYTVFCNCVLGWGMVRVLNQMYYKPLNNISRVQIESFSPKADIYMSVPNLEMNAHFVREGKPFVVLC